MASSSKLRLVSFDGGGMRCFSQLKMMQRLMHQLQGKIHPNEQNKKIFPHEQFDLIGGSDFGGIIAIMFARLGMSVEEAMQALGILIKSVYAEGLQPKERTEMLRECMKQVLGDRGLPIDSKLEEEKPTKGCSGFVMAAGALNVEDKARLRTYFVEDEPPSGISIVDAVLATCASPPEFHPVTVGPSWDCHSYAGAGIGANNPIRHVLDEASSRKMKPTVLLSLGSGDPGVLSLEHDQKDEGLRKLMYEMMIDCEQEDKAVRQLWTNPEFYFRFSVVQGLQNVDERVDLEGLEWVVAQADAYFRLPNTRSKVFECVERMVSGKP